MVGSDYIRDNATMSLIYFHILLIATAIVFAVGFGAWEFSAYAKAAKTIDLASSIGSFLAGAGLFVYLVWFIKKRKRR